MERMHIFSCHLEVVVVLVCERTVQHWHVLTIGGKGELGEPHRRGAWHEEKYREDDCQDTAARPTSALPTLLWLFWDHIVLVSCGCGFDVAVVRSALYGHVYWI